MFALQLLPFLASLHLLQAQHTRPHYDFNYTVLSSSVALYWKYRKILQNTEKYWEVLKILKNTEKYRRKMEIYFSPLPTFYKPNSQHTRPHYDFNYTVLSSSVALSVFILSPLDQQCQNCIPALIIAVCYPWHSVCYSVYSVCHQTKYFFKLKSIKMI